MFKDKLCFLYICGRGNLNIHELTSVSETELYYQGVTRSGYRTFRKDRIIQFADTAAELTQQLHTFDTEDWLKHYLVQQAISRHQQKAAAKVCFTGFKKERKAELQTIAVNAGLQLLTGVSKNLTFLCYSYNAGPAKMEQARELGVLILNETEFLTMLETGEIPDY